ncbi:MAG: DMT family protein [Bacteroidia bacterium]|nr:DMT family protein [Bacteroidia bacterium]
MDARLKTILLLFLSNIFMTLAWYGHLHRLKDKSLWIVILISWGIAFFEYCLQVPANRIGAGKFSLVELKTIQEVLSLIVFAIYTILIVREDFKWNYLVGFVFLVLAVFFIFKKWD